MKKEEVRMILVMIAMVVLTILAGYGLATILCNQGLLVCGFTP